MESTAVKQEDWKAWGVFSFFEEWTILEDFYATEAEATKCVRELERECPEVKFWAHHAPELAADENVQWLLARETERGCSLVVQVHDYNNGYVLSPEVAEKKRKAAGTGED
jgi:hypothetical protein